MAMSHDVLLIGGGQAGLAAGYHLRRGVSTTVPGLIYVGLSNQSTYASGTLRGVGPDAAYAVQQLQRHLRAADPARHVRTSSVGRLLGTWRCCAGKEGAI